MQVGASVTMTLSIPFFSGKTILPYTALKEADSNLLKALALHPESYEQINV